MADLTDIITNAVAEAGGGEADADNSPTDSGSDESDASEGVETISGDTESTATGSTAVSPSSGAASSAGGAVKPQEPDEATKRLEDLGLKAPKVGERENRLPHSRVVKIVENAEKRLAAKHTTELAERDSRLTAAEQRLQNMDRVDELIATDPDRYIQTLAALNPEYKRFLAPREVKREEPKQVPAGEKRPAPDVKYSDGSVGYSAEGLDNLLEWQAQQAESRVEKRLREEYDKRLGPIEQERQASAYVAKQQPIIKNQIETAKKQWGKLFEDDYNLNGNSEILKVMKANNGQQGRPYLPFDACIAQVLLPRMHAEREKLSTDRNKVRSEVMTELDARPAAAQRNVPVASKSTPEGGPRSVEDIIREQVATLKR